MPDKRVASNFHLGLLVDQFPNIVQPYIVNQIHSLECANISVQLFSRQSASSNTLQPETQAVKLRLPPIYINANVEDLLQNLSSLPLFNFKYIKAVITIVRSPHWRQHGMKHLVRNIILARILLHKKIDLLHTHTLLSCFEYLFLRQNFSIPLITTYHGITPPGVPVLAESKTKLVFETGDLFLVNTQSARNDLITLGCPENKIKIIPQGTNLEQFPYMKHNIREANRIRLLSVGRLSLEKGHKTAVKAVARLISQYPDIEYHIIGDGPERNNLELLARKLKLTKNIIFNGFLTPDQVNQYYRSCHILLLPSFEETQGTVLQEAQASGIAVIGSKAGGIPEVIIENETGLLFNTGDENELAEKIKRLVSEPDLYEKITTHGRADVEQRFDIKKICHELISIYRNFINPE